MFKIGFTGTHGTGKTTYAYDIATKLKYRGYDVSVVTEVARNCPYKINEETTVKSQLWILSRMLNDEISSKSQITICDRTLLDVYAYTKRVDEELAEAILPFVLYWYKTYDIVFFMEINEDYKLKDGIRSTNKKFQKEIQDVLAHVTNKYHLKYYLRGGNREMGFLDDAKFIENKFKGKC